MRSSWQMCPTPIAPGITLPTFEAVVGAFPPYVRTYGGKAPTTASKVGSVIPGAIGVGHICQELRMTHYLKVGLTVVVVMAIVFRVAPLRQIVTGS